MSLKLNYATKRIWLCWFIVLGGIMSLGSLFSAYFFGGFNTASINKDLRGAWHCLSEPGVVRVFYENFSYLEFGRAVPFARKDLWKTDYISTGRYSLLRGVLTIKKNTDLLTAGVKPRRRFRKITITPYKIHELRGRVLFLKRNNSQGSTHAGDMNTSLLCKKLSSTGFARFIFYIQKKRTHKKLLVQLIRRKKLGLAQLIRKKKRIAYRLNRVLCRTPTVESLWILNKLEQLRRKKFRKFSLKILRQNGNYFNVKIVFTTRGFQRTLLEYFRDSGKVTVRLSPVYNHNNKLFVNLHLKRVLKSRPCVSLVSLPASLMWLSHHKVQLTQLQSLETYRNTLKARDVSLKPVKNLLASLSRIKKEMQTSISRKHHSRLQWTLLTTRPVSYNITYTGNYGSIKRMLRVLLSRQLSGKVLKVKIAAVNNKTTYASLQSSANLVRLWLTVAPHNKQVINPLGKWVAPDLTLKTHLISIIRPKRSAAIAPVINLFF